VKCGEPLPSLAEYYRGGLRVVAQPGTVFAYSNHGFATLGQIIEDVSGTTLERYFQERIFQPLGMRDTDLVRSAPIGARLATGYTLGRRGAQVVPDRVWIGAAAGGIYSTTSDIARFAAALMRGGTNGHGPVLDPAALARCRRPLPARSSPSGVGARSPAEAKRISLVGHDGFVPLQPAPGGPRRRRRVVPHQRVKGAFLWLQTEFEAVRDLLGVPDEVVRTDIAPPRDLDGDCGATGCPRIADCAGVWRHPRVSRCSPAAGTW
jgi:CubicO group peptidase (beta-lactamase class C family)